ncbi:MAG: N(4)-(beta-N-acetylglucosaminyl)-L-asparaginase [Phycisphaeraceae bacterium]|nr:N(4)-(beta-N-acetylglucosaminyl)-L-asparaginase [Phycisphaeraceae bacterium]
MNPIHRRSFMLAGAATLASLSASRAAGRGRRQPDSPPIGATAEDLRRWSGHRGPCVISSGNGLPAVARAWDVMAGGADPVDAVVEGVTLVEDDPNDMTVGLGGLPNEDGVVQLDASVMHGPTHKAGAVACLEGIRNPAKVALLVLKTTDHILLVGEGAKRFALRHGFKEENLLTEAARRAWLRWKASLSPEDDWLDPGQMDFQVSALHGREASQPGAVALGPVPHTTGTINCSAVNADGNLGSCTTTSGLSWKIPGRVGDSPIVGAGMYVDNAVGAAGATGRGEAVIANCGAFSIVREMERGLEPTEACLAVLRQIASRTLERRNRNDRGEPNFNVSMYAVRKDGAYGSACLRPGGSFAVHDGQESRRWRCPSVFE